MQLCASSGPWYFYVESLSAQDLLITADMGNYNFYSSFYILIHKQKESESCRDAKITINLLYSEHCYNFRQQLLLFSSSLSVLTCSCCILKLLLATLIFYPSMPRSDKYTCNFSLIHIGVYVPTHRLLSDHSSERDTSSLAGDIPLRHISFIPYFLSCCFFDD